MSRVKIDLNRAVGGVLITGVALSLIILLCGSVLYLRHPVHGPVSHSLSHILRGVVRMDPAATLNLGLLILLLTPVTRIIAALIVFISEGSRKFVLISLAILLILAISTTIGYYIRFGSGGH